jgi:hypothetical protein
MFWSILFLNNSNFMAKVIGPLMSVSASGKYANSLVFGSWKGINTVRRFVIPANPQTDDQVAVRDIVHDASIAWKNSATVGSTALDAAYKLAYDTAAAGQKYSGFNLFIKDCVELNGGKAYDGSLEAPTVPGDVTPGA